MLKLKIQVWLDSSIPIEIKLRYGLDYERGEIQCRVIIGTDQIDWTSAIGFSVASTLFWYCWLANWRICSVGASKSCWIRRWIREREKKYWIPPYPDHLPFPFHCQMEFSLFLLLSLLFQVEAFLLVYMQSEGNTAIN